MRDFTERGDVQPGIVRQTGGALGQGTGQTNDLVIFHAPGGDDHHRCPQLALILG
ncbi:hypothetical protein D3C76_1851130 [compost metagenome]